MTFGFYLRSFCGFAPQLVPCVLLLLIPFREEAFIKGKHRAVVYLTALSIGFSLCYMLLFRWNMYAPDRNLDDNLFMLLAGAGCTILFIWVTHESPVRKFTVLFVVISYAAVQYFLSNMLMEFLPLVRQAMIYNDATLAAYLIVTAVILPPTALFMRGRLKQYLGTLDSASGSRFELFFLAAVLMLYLILNVLYSALWVQLRDTLQLGFSYYIPFSLFLSVLLIFTFYCTINLSVFKARSAEQTVELALMRQNYNHIEENIRQQKRALHDTRQLLRNISVLAREETTENLLKFIDESIEYTTVSDTIFCSNPCINGLLGYYTSLAEAQGTVISVRAVCDQLPFSDTELTILLGSALDNAVCASVEYAQAFPEPRPKIQFTADTINDQFAVQIENPCLSVSYAKAFRQNSSAGGRNWLPADAFLSTHGGGYGLRSMERITKKYGGHVWFAFDRDNHSFITRLMLPVRGV